jgi:hypothetical protein
MAKCSSIGSALLSHSQFRRKEVTFEGEGKVLLSRIGDKIHATSAFCTHYGAPLAKGVLTPMGGSFGAFISLKYYPIANSVLARGMEVRLCHLSVIIVHPEWYKQHASTSATATSVCPFPSDAYDLLLHTP